VEGSPDVLALFRTDPFRGQPPKIVRSVLWQYWFTDMKTMQSTGEWWRRREIGQFAPPAMRGIDGRIVIGGNP
jgi:hypothetical protein